MIPTARKFGLTINSLVDERRDPIKSSWAAARYLKELYNRYNDWTLAIAAYNCGPSNIAKAIKRAGGVKDIGRFILISLAKLVDMCLLSLLLTT